MNILILTASNDSFNSVRPELEIFVSLAKAGHNVTIMTQENTPYTERLKSHGIELFHTEYQRKISLKTILLIRKIIREKFISIVYATNSKAISNAIFATLALPVKLIVYRGTTGGLYRHDISSYLNALNPRVDGIVCVSKSVENHVRKQLKRTKKRVVTIYKGHDTAWYNETPANLEIFGTNPTNFNVAFVANVREHKGLIYLLEAAHHLADIPNLHILLIGNHIDQPHYLEVIEKSGMKERIHLTGHRKDVPQIIASCDVLIHASTRKEGLPRVILESLASGTPVIASANESSLEIIQDHVNGLIVPIKDALSIAQKIRSLYESPTLLNELKANVKKTIDNEFSHTKTVSNYLQFFESL